MRCNRKESDYKEVGPIIIVSETDVCAVGAESENRTPRK